MSRYRCVDAQKAAGFPVVAACDAAGVSASAFYAWATRCEQGPRAAEHAEAELVAEIRTIHADSAGTYGSPRVTHELRRRGWRVNHKRVERLMAAHGIVGHRPRRRRGLTKADAAAPPAPDLLGRLFDPDRIDVAWCGDVTFIPTDEGWLYLAAVLDLASRHLLGWSMGERHDAGLVTDALQAAVATRGRSRDGFHHLSHRPRQPRRIQLVVATPRAVRGVDGTTTGSGGWRRRPAADAVAWSAAGGAA